MNEKTKQVSNTVIKETVDDIQLNSGLPNNTENLSGGNELVSSKLPIEDANNRHDETKVIKRQMENTALISQRKSHHCQRSSTRLHSDVEKKRLKTIYVKPCYVVVTKYAVLDCNKNVIESAPSDASNTAEIGYNEENKAAQLKQHRFRETKHLKKCPLGKRNKCNDMSNKTVYKQCKYTEKGIKRRLKNTNSEEDKEVVGVVKGKEKLSQGEGYTNCSDPVRRKEKESNKKECQVKEYRQQPTVAEQYFDEYVEWRYRMRCLICSTIFNSRSDFAWHTFNEQHCIDKFVFIKDGKKYLRCTPCGYVSKYRWKFNFLSHLVCNAEHGQWGSVNVSPDLQNKQKDVTEGNRLQHGPQERVSNINSSCTEGDCQDNFRFETETDATRHASPSCLTASKDLVKHEKGGWYCKYCKVVIKGWYKNAAIDHIKFYHTKELQHMCTLCKRILSCEERLKKHMKTNHAASNVCSVCGKLFDSSNKLYVHERDVHNIMKAGYVKPVHQCQYCQKSFSRKRLKDEHERLTHSTAKNEVCYLCGKSYKRKLGLKIHIKHKHKDSRVTCNICGKTMKGFGLYNHKYIHKERKYKCDICDKRFVYKHHLCNHMIVHTGERKFKCHICELAFGLKHHLESHLKSKHNICTTKKV